jgi:hypothetical protein
MATLILRLNRMLHAGPPYYHTISRTLSVPRRNSRRETGSTRRSGARVSASPAGQANEPSLSASGGTFGQKAPARSVASALACSQIRPPGRRDPRPPSVAPSGLCSSGAGRCQDHVDGIQPGRDQSPRGFGAVWLGTGRLSQEQPPGVRRSSLFSPQITRAGLAHLPLSLHAAVPSVTRAAFPSGMRCAG